MGKQHKGYNWKARQVVQTVVDNSITKKIELDLNVGGHYDQSNELVLPSKKRKTKIKEDRTKVTKILSKKHRKRLEKIVEKKKKKENRASLLEALSQVQATPEELSQLTSITKVQTTGIKRYLQEEANPEHSKKSKRDEGTKAVVRNSIKGSKRRQIIDDVKKKKAVDDPNVVGFDSSDSSDESDEEEEVKEAYDHSENNTNKDNSNEINVKPQTSAKEEQINDKVIEIDDSNVENEPEAPKTDSLIEKQPRKEIERKPAVYVDVVRDEAIQAARFKLPILGEEQQIMEVINDNSVIIIAGETGSGKTTQVPQFLYEAGYAVDKQIAVTEPRRIAAISMSKRIAEEMSLTSDEVSYLIRFEGNVTDNTKIKFMTDGVLLKELQKDFLLSKYSVVILDEAHERSVNTDVLIGFLSRIVLLRKKRGDPLKLIIMSATLRLEDFTNNKKLFKITPPVLEVKTRQFDVTVHFNKHTQQDYLKESFRKVVKIHSTEPQGGILVFLTGQREVNTLVRKLRKAFPYNPKKALTVTDDDIDNKLGGILRNRKRKRKLILPKIDLDDYKVPVDGDEASDIDLSEGELSNEDDQDEELTVYDSNQPLWVLPLYSLLPTQKQVQIFRPPPPGCRFCVVSTNVAETSLTIPGIKYVVDSGRTKTKLYDKVTGVSSYIVTWTSKASAKQRAGRAGRLGPGHCYRLYSSAVFEHDLPQFEEPEIRKKPIDDLYLQMKCMNFKNVANFPFPTSPDPVQLNAAEARLEILEAVKDGKVTPIGRIISKFPILPRYGKMIALSHQHDLLPYTIMLVAALSVQEVLLETPVQFRSADETKAIVQKWKTMRRQWVGTGNALLLGDNMVLLKAVGAAEFANSQGKLEKFCTENGLRHKAVAEIRKIRIQLSNQVKLNEPEANAVVDPKLPPPSDLQAKLLRQILLCGLGDQIARKIPADEAKDRTKSKYAYQANNMEDPVYLHSSSVLRTALPEYVVFQEIYQTNNKMYMRGVTAIEQEWLAAYVPTLCNLSEPLAEPAPYYNAESDKVFCHVAGTFGKQAWPLRSVEVEHPNNLDCYKWFARFLLEGQVFSKLKEYESSLLTQPSVMAKSWAKLLPRTDAILKKLVSQEAASKAKLVELWQQNPRYLLNEYLMWLPQSTHGEVTLNWPPRD